MVQCKEHPPYDITLEKKVLLNPLARASADAEGSYSFTKALPTSATPTVKSGNASIAAKLVAAATKGVHGVGSDVEREPFLFRLFALSLIYINNVFPFNSYLIDPCRQRKLPCPQLHRC